VKRIKLTFFYIKNVNNALNDQISLTCCETSGIKQKSCGAIISKVLFLLDEIKKTIITSIARRDVNVF